MGPADKKGEQQYKPRRFHIVYAFKKHTEICGEKAIEIKNIWDKLLLCTL